MSNKPKAKTNITKITANSAPKAETETKPEKVEKAAAPIAKTTQKPAKNTEEKPLKEVFILARPFVAFGRYLRDSWREIRQVRWPNRKATWKMTFAVFIYCAIFMVFILVLDALFTFIFDLLLGIN
jgi:preprotein translocase SecE subunit